MPSRQSGDALAALAEPACETVRKEELIAAIWPDNAVTDDRRL